MTDANYARSKSNYAKIRNRDNNARALWNLNLFRKLCFNWFIPTRARNLRSSHNNCLCIYIVYTCVQIMQIILGVIIGSFSYYETRRNCLNNNFDDNFSCAGQFAFFLPRNSHIFRELRYRSTRKKLKAHYRGNSYTLYRCSKQVENISRISHKRR